MTDGTRPEVAYAYDQAVLLLRADLAKQIPGVATETTTAGVPIHRSYNEREPAESTSISDATLLVISNASRTGTLAIIPVALFEREGVMASCGLSGSLAPQVRATVLEVIVARDGAWSCLGRQRLPSGRYPTYPFIEYVRSVLMS